MMAGSRGGDLSGTSQDAHQHLLGWIEDKEIPAILCVGIPGSGKSAFAKATGNEAGVPTIRFDLGGMQGSLRGESEQAIRHSTQVVDAVSQGRPFIVATCNDHSSLSPEFRSRFLNTYYFDNPDRDEKDVIWPIWETQYAVSGPRPDDSNWTGREIKKCCRIASLLGWSLIEAAQQIVPVAQSAAAEYDALRRAADGTFLSASYVGPYRYTPPTADASARALDFTDTFPAHSKGVN